MISKTEMGIVANGDAIRDILATLYDVMQRNNFANFSSHKKVDFIHDYIHGFSEAAKIYPEMIAKYQDAEHNFSEFIHFLEDLSLKQNSRVNHWLIPPIYPANGCDNPYILEANVSSINDINQARAMTMSEIQSIAIKSDSSSSKSCRTCVKDRHGPIKKQNEISVLKQQEYRPTTCTLRDVQNSGFQITINTNLKNVHRIQAIEFPRKMKEQFLRLSKTRKLDSKHDNIVANLRKRGWLRETEMHGNNCILNLEFGNMDGMEIAGSERVWSKAGYRNIIKKKRRSKSSSPEDIFTEVRMFLQSIGESCNPIRHNHIGDLFNPNITTPIYGDEFWPALYVKCHTSIIEKIQDVAMARGDSVPDEYKQVPFMLDDDMSGAKVEIAIDPIAFWM